MNTVHQQNVVVRSPYFPAINWGAIFAGIVVGLATQLVLALLGFAAGLSAVDVGEDSGRIQPSAPLFAGAWQGVSMLVAAFVGGYVAARMSGLHRKSDGMLHGFVAWAATTLLFAILATSAVGSFFGGVFDTAGRAALERSAVAESPGNAGSLATQLESLVRGNEAATAPGAVNPEAIGQLQEHIEAGDREGAIAYMVQSMGFDPQRAAAIVDQALIVSGNAESASPEAQDQAGRTVDTATVATWTVFGAVALSLLLGVIGGLVGAKSSHRAPRVTV